MNSSRQERLGTARALILQHRYDAASAILSDLLLSSPADFDALMLAAQLHLHVRNFERAYSAAAMVARLNPADPGALYLLGRVHKARGEIDQAESFYRRAIAANPHDPNTLTSLGVLLRGKGQLHEAIALYRRALAIKPDHPEANNNLGNALAAEGAGRQSVDRRGRAQAVLLTELDQMRAAAASLTQQGNLRDALAVLKASLRIAPTAADLWLRTGELATKLGMIAEALPYLEEAYRLDPRSYKSVALAWQICVAGGLREPAIRYSKLAFEFVPSEEILVTTKILLPAIQDSRESIDATRRQYEQGLDDVLTGSYQPSSSYYRAQTTAFFLAYHGECNRDVQIKAARMYLKLIPDLATSAPHCSMPTRHPGKIRIGFISKFLQSHSIGKTTRGLIEKLARNRFEVYALRIMPSIEDQVTGQICRSADHAIILDPEVPRAREQIASLRLDILFYQDIGLDPTAYFLAFARLAPVQSVSFGHPDTTGIPNMDYFVSSDLFEIPEAAAHYSERLFLLHDLPTLAYYYKPTRQRTVGREAFGLPAGATLYLCPQALFKIHPDFDDLLRGILTRDTSGVAVFIGGIYPQWTEMLRQRFARTMPEISDRVIFLASMENEVFLELLAVADVILDPVHFNGMNSSLESLAVGTPVVTLPTTLQRGRHTQAMYRKMGILDCIATDKDDYIDIAVRLGTNRAYARDVSDRILARNHVLFEDLQVVREFERFFIESMRERFGLDAISA